MFSQSKFVEENVSGDDESKNEMQVCEEVAQVTFKEGGDDFSPTIESETLQRRKSLKVKQGLRKSKREQPFCSVPKCLSGYLLSLGVNLSRFQVPHQNDPEFSNVRFKWIKTLEYFLETEKNVSNWANVCELHFPESSLVLSESDSSEKQIKKKLLPNSFPTIFSSIFNDDSLDEIKGEQDTTVSISNTRYEGKSIFKQRIVQVLKESGIDLSSALKANLKKRFEIDLGSICDSDLQSERPPCTILKPLAKDGEAPLPAIVLPGIDHRKAVELLEDKNIQELLKNLAEKHKNEMINKMLEEGHDEEMDTVDELGKSIRVKRKMEIPPPPTIILQATKLCPNQTPDPKLPSVVQQAIDKTFDEQKVDGKKQSMIDQNSKEQKLPAERKILRLFHEDFLESLPAIESKYVLNEDGNVIPALSGDHDYGPSSRNSGISIFDPAGLRQEIERWRCEVESIRQKNFDLSARLADVKFSRSSGIKSRGSATERKKLEKLEVANQKMAEELVRLKLERRRMLSKERNRRRKRLKVLERRQKRRDWIMQQIEIGNMTKEHLELVYSRKKLPYEKKASQSNNISVFPLSIPSGESEPISVTIQRPMISNDSTTHISGQLVGKKRSRAITKTNSENEQFDDLSEVTSVVVTDLHPADMDDGNVVVSSIPGVVITGRLNGSHQIIVEGTSEEYTPEQIDMIVRAVDDLEVNSWRMSTSPRD